MLYDMKLKYLSLITLKAYYLEKKRLYYIESKIRRRINYQMKGLAFCSLKLFNTNLRKVNKDKILRKFINMNDNSYFDDNGDLVVIVGEND
jgi:hypothetical protein